MDHRNSACYTELIQAANGHERTGVTVTRRFMTPAKLAVLIVASALACYSAWGPNAYRHHKSLIDLPSVTAGAHAANTTSYDQ